MAVPFLFDRPETMTERTLDQEADFAAMGPLLAYAGALSQIDQIPMTGPGGTIYMGQAEERGNLMNRLASGLGSALGNVETQRQLKLDEARNAQRSARLRSEQQILDRRAREAAQIGRAVADSTLNMMDIIGRQQTRLVHVVMIG